MARGIAINLRSHCEQGMMGLSVGERGGRERREEIKSKAGASSYCRITGGGVQDGGWGDVGSKLQQVL